MAESPALEGLSPEQIAEGKALQAAVEVETAALAVDPYDACQLANAAASLDGWLFANAPALLASAERLVKVEEALRRYGQHEWSCGAHDEYEELDILGNLTYRYGECDCDLDASLASAALHPEESHD